MTITGRRPLNRTARRGYVAAAVLAVVGVLGAGTWAGAALLDRLDAPTGFSRAVPGDAVELSAGRHVLYVEGTAPAALGGVRVTGPDGVVLDLRPVGDVRYDVPAGVAEGRDDVVGTAVGELRATEPGPYTLDTDGSVPDGVRLAVGEDVARAALRAVVPPGALAVVTVVGAIALAARTASRTADPSTTTSRPEAGR
ncbi:hypothetical protein [Actinotalea sp. Marseille-Q4924]|uniref:hypothetical protein n=1 Tax=Actinotalea sp. Marseille-Q4924 TaxID=2866571 RepID=UPI001CE4A6CE|nr:hypothetical protein [Actinotalea sp. Marseille-Q4924]